MATPRVRRGRKTQELVCEWFRERGWPHAQNTPASIPGRDVTGMPGLAPEVKATRDGTSPTAAVRQAHRNAGPDLPFVVLRPDGYGPERVGQWLALLDLTTLTRLLHEAGYGTPPGAAGDTSPAPGEHDPT